MQPHHLIKLLLLLIISTTSSCNFEDETETLAWMSKTSSIKIPGHRENQILFNNHEWGVITKFKLDRRDFVLFTERYSLTPLDEEGFEMPLLHDIEHLSFDQKFIKNPRDYLYFSDCKTGNSWSVLGSKKSLYIWFEVLYPDNGGDIGPCEKDTVGNSLQ